MPITSAEAQLLYEGSSFMNLEFFFQEVPFLGAKGNLHKQAQEQKI